MNRVSNLGVEKAIPNERSCWSRSIKSASLFKSRDLSKPVTFFPQVVLKAARAAFTAMSISFSDPEEWGKVSSRLSPKTPSDKPATTLQISSSVAGLIALQYRGVGTHRQPRDHFEITHPIVSCESTDGTNSLLMNNPVGSSIVRPVAGILIFAI